jgi:hypothetical protein
MSFKVKERWAGDDLISISIDPEYDKSQILTKRPPGRAAS